MMDMVLSEYKRKMGLFLLGNLFFLLGMGAQETVGTWHVVREFPQKSFPKTVPAGNYSGITHLHDDIYAVVSDKSDSALYFNFRMQVNPRTGELENVENLGFTEYVDGYRINPDGSRQATEHGFDHEAIAKVSDTTLVISSEGKFRLKEYPIVDTLAAGTNRLAEGLWQWSMPSSAFYPNYVFESLAYDSVRLCLWTIPESTLREDGVPATPQNGNANQLRLMCFDWKSGTGAYHPLVATYKYLMDRPSTDKHAETYVMGVSELCALPDGQLLVLEREAFIPKMKVGAFCRCKLYVISPSSASMTSFLPKKLLTEWKTTLTLFGRSFANYEGMCLGPQSEDGSQVLILLSDSQDQYAGILKDWFKTIVIKKS